MKPYTYLLVNLTCFIIPFLASFYPKHAFYKNWKPFFKANIIVAFLFIIWDYLFTRAGVWGFNPEYLSGFYITNLPIEEILFFFCIPYACVFTYFAFQFLIKKNPFQSIHKVITYSIIAFLLIVGLLNFNKLYTSITFISLCILLIIFKLKKINLSYHYLSYLFILPFFFISNGILTGSFLVDPIVWYNDAENLGFRIINIPIEDMVYGMLLVFLNIEMFEYFKSIHKKS
ncbi:lycopene cyclase domain-containing protein [Yeosuana sp. MJ-SS3]|uniref:Lycopene cyclase domain-containing protein n=1 Tax=Gilvirhabdus luticola TaxID=3079858 RepID=A0ABU3U850_9FLAO|nr:lycopene cyclase domain-containing protein [Yeosuana sp. MJ-SS3]MDU8886598.1 lycopene cyclase domain-containing protein [Yeosuana sp. MJ-SS3]